MYIGVRGRGAELHAAHALDRVMKYIMLMRLERAIALCISQLRNSETKERSGPRYLGVSLSVSPHLDLKPDQWSRGRMWVGAAGGGVLPFCECTSPLASLPSSLPHARETTHLRPRPKGTRGRHTLQPHFLRQRADPKSARITSSRNRRSRIDLYLRSSAQSCETTSVVACWRQPLAVHMRQPGACVAWSLMATARCGPA